VDSVEAISALRLVVAIVIFAVASVLDIRTRKVGNKYWIAMAAIGLVLFPIQLSVEEMGWEYLWVLVPILAVLSDVYMEAKPDTLLDKYGPVLKYAIAVVSVVALGYLWGGEQYFQHLLAVPVMMLAIVGLYMLDVIRGGADAKALVSLSILFPFYPEIGGLPVVLGETDLATIVFPFAFTVLVTAAVIVAIVMPLGFLVVNIAARDMRFPNVLFGLREDVDKARTSHVWLMERIEKGQHVFYTRPRRDEDLGKELDILKSAGASRVWVTPKIPFMVPMLAGLVISATLGNLLFLLFPI